MARTKTSPELFLRFGPWHASERSRNYARGGSEAGVSVYDVKYNVKLKRWDVHMPPEEDSDNPWGPEDTFWTLIKDAQAVSDPIFIVRGEVVGVGHDGEPLVQNIVVVQQVSLHEIMSTDLRWKGVK